MKNIYLIMVLILVFALALPINSAVFVNNGAVIVNSSKTYYHVNQLTFKNINNGRIFINSGSEFYVKGNVVNSSDSILIRNGSVFKIDSSFTNSSKLNIMDTSSVQVKGSLVNTGQIINYYVLDIGF